MGSAAKEASHQLHRLGNSDLEVLPGMESRCCHPGRLAIYCCLQLSCAKARIFGACKAARLSCVMWSGVQVIVASDDDTTPILQMWDLRNAHSPAKVRASCMQPIVTRVSSLCSVPAEIVSGADTAGAFAGYSRAVVEPARQFDAPHVRKGQPYDLLESQHGKHCNECLCRVKNASREWAEC